MTAAPLPCFARAFATLLALAMLGACQPNYPGAGYVALAVILDAPHAAAQQQSRVVEDEIGGVTP